MKLYVHLEEISPSFTLLYQPTSFNATVSDLIQAFVSAYNAKHGEGLLDVAQLSITNERRKTLAPTSTVEKVAKDKEDLFVIISTPSKPAGITTAPTTIPTSPSVPISAPIPNRPTLASSTSTPSDTQSPSTVPSNTPPALSAPESPTPSPNTSSEIPPPPTSTSTSSETSPKPPTQASTAAPETSPTSPGTTTQVKRTNWPTTTRVDQTSTSIPPLPPMANAEISAALASHLRDVQLSNGSGNRPMRLEQYPTGVQEWVKESIQISDRTAQQGNFRQAIAIHEQILKIVPQHAQSLLRLGELYFAAGRSNLAIEWFTKGSISSPDVLFEMGVADSNYQKGDYMEAAKYYLRALRMAENSPNAEFKTKVQVLVAKALYKSGGKAERETALQIVTTVLRVNEEHPEALHVYGMAMRDMRKIGDAVKVYLKILILNPNDKAVKEDLADLLQQEGGMKALYTELAPTPTSAPAYAYIGTFIKEFGAVSESVALYKKALAIKSDSASYCLNLVHTMEVMGTYKEAFNVIKDFCKQNMRLTVGGCSCEKIYNVLKNVDDLQEHSDKIWISPEEAATQPVQKFDVAPQKGTTPDRTLKPYDSDQLDLLALFATISKIAYVVGGLDIIPEIIKLIEPAREGRELHTTPVRNEMAYYSCVAQLMLTQSLPLVNYRKIYVVGDSHSLSPGWRTINVKGEKILLQPSLVTGLKIWHLRPNTKFFPKANFHNVIRKIPKGSTIIIALGEIDCREGLLVSVEKCRYNDLDEAISTSLNIYIGVIRQLIKDHNFTVYVHPPPPVLDPTRKQVKKYAQALKERLKTEQGIYYLDIFDAMLAPDKDDLYAPYKFDGTHLDPCYITLIESALNKL
eukprot:Phypoly_transcript_02636.p1 GENE.Phypoly_transcript_02636~~Phypoly_transcript_02636.p1  ORF type:complete len:874 (+),score=132.36 Phypoly_transcript_02636:48-2624(+)